MEQVSQIFGSSKPNQNDTVATVVSANALKTIAVLGMGAMGTRMAKSLLHAGFAVTVWNIVAQACQPLVALGAQHATTPREAATSADFVIAMVWDDEASRYVWLDKDVGALTGMKPGAIALECATLTIGHEKNLATACSQHGIEFVSAPMSGSLPEADNRTLVFTVGASEAAFKSVEPVLLAMGSRVSWAGGPTDGISLKLTINGKLGIEYVAAAEMTALMTVADMDTERRIGIMSGTAPFSARGLREMQFMLDRNQAVRVKVNQLIKDLGNQILQFDAYAVPCPIHRAALHEFELARDAGYGESDAISLCAIYQARAVAATDERKAVDEVLETNQGLATLFS